MPSTVASSQNVPVACRPVFSEPQAAPARHRRSSHDNGRFRATDYWLLATGDAERTHVAVLLVAPREERIGREPEKRIELGDHALAQRQGGHAVVAVGAAGWLWNNAVDDAALEQLLGRDAHRGRRLRGMNG